MCTKPAALIAALTLSLSLWGCGTGGVQPSAGGTEPALRVFVGIEPVAYLVERIAGPRAAVDVLVAAGQSPHTYEPTPKQITHLSTAAAYLSLNLEFEQAITQRLRAIRPDALVVDLQEGIALRTAEHDCADHGHAHHDHEAHAAGLPDLHTWLSPRLAAQQAATICAALSRLDPSGADAYRSNLARLQTELAELDARIRSRLEPYRGAEFMVFHPAYGYFADAYGLTQVPIEADGKQPGAAGLTQLVKRARANRIRTIFLEPQYPPHVAEAFAREISARVVELDPLARDYLLNLEQMALRIEESIRERL